MIKKIKQAVISRSNFLIRKIYSGEGFVFMLHRVLPQNEREKYNYNRSLSISPEALEKYILDFKSKGYDLISMDEALKRIEKPTNKKFIAFTIDDGYKDNLEHGLSVFEKHNVPVTIYVTTCFPEMKAIYWWYFLEDFLSVSETLDLTSIGVNLKLEGLTNQDKKEKAYHKAAGLIKPLSYDGHLKFVTEVCGVGSTQLLEYNEKNNMSWAEIFDLNKSPLVSIGAHTLDHLSLKNQKSAVSENQISESILILEQKLGEKIKHFAYPYGSLEDAGEREFGILKGLHLKSGVFNHPGSVFLEHKSNPYQIPRIGLCDETKQERLDAFFSGKLHFGFNGSNKLIS
jgi:peptidoglycan/xylan/chitin deacetylase (PgdA/CDA1 family)